jgi:GH25 family lysozyme M1 (1,4-beta-N-acetylmuramidase)
MKGIDIYRGQGAVDWNAVKESGVQFVILKAGGSDDGFYTDAAFERNYAGAKAAGIAVGAYYYVGRNCTSKADGVADAERFAKIIEGKQFECPVYIDLEATRPEDRAGATEACTGFCEYMESQGYYCGIYASDISGFIDRLDLNKLKRFDKWVARYGSQPQRVAKYGIWQYSETGRVPGISGNVDLDESYVDYPSVIVKGGFNGFPKQDPDPLPYTPNMSETDIARIPYIAGMTAADVQTYIRWVTCKGAGDFPDTEDGFRAFLSENT